MQEYPKAVVVGKDKDGAPIQKIANSAEEEKALGGAPKEKPSSVPSLSLRPEDGAEEKQPEPIADQLSKGVVQKGVA